MSNTAEGFEKKMDKGGGLLIERRGFLDFRAEVVGPKRRKTGIGSSAGRRVGPKREKSLNGPIRKREN